MSVLINSKTQCIIQGITGKEGARALQWMTQLGTTVVAGVTPGKGGQTVSYSTLQGKQEVPVFDSVVQAVAKFPQISATAIYAPPQFVLAAAQEAIEAEIPLIYIIAEGVPLRDSATLLELVRRSNSVKATQIRVLGPSSIGAYSVGKASIGSIAAGKQEGLLAPFSDKVLYQREKGGVIVISKSGGMALTVAQSISRAGIAISTMVGIGGDVLLGTTFADLLRDIANDQESWAVVIVGEIGGSYEEQLAVKIKDLGFSKPVVAFVSGRFAELLPQGVSFGHAGAIVSKKYGTRTGKINALSQSGVLIADSPQDIVKLLREV